MTTHPLSTSEPGDAVLHTDPAGLHPPAWTAAVRAAWPPIASLAVAAVLCFGVLPHVNGYKVNLVGNCGVAIMLAVSLTVVNGFTGQFSIGHSGFLALGGYAAAAMVYYGTYRLFGDLNFHGGRLSGGPPGSPLLARGDGLFFAALLFGGVVAAAVGWIVGLPSASASAATTWRSSRSASARSSGSSFNPPAPSSRPTTTIGLPGLVDPGDLERGHAHVPPADDPPRRRARLQHRPDLRHPLLDHHRGACSRWC